MSRQGYRRKVICSHELFAGFVADHKIQTCVEKQLRVNLIYQTIGIDKVNYVWWCKIFCLSFEYRNLHSHHDV